jgi:hypothetical protein
MQLTLADEVILLRSQVDYLLELLSDNPSLTNKPVNWRDLTIDDAAEQWGRLVDWVNWLRDRYNLQERVPACWYAHGPLIEELSARRGLWKAAFLDKDATAGTAIAFHDALDRILHGIQRWDHSGCRDGQHRPEAGASDTTDESHRERAIHADLTSREPHLTTRQQG